ncbi:tetratricopeptide repeat protein [Caulobacter sp. SLTY]|uniref:tetratricopeptide repeat protein n=1 Tax=Caulobacter sp. SLTY TaxID=2683262 RepID=UPI00196AAF4B|nr:tetratricopeptide repeat protein [Caulobacter sp. SLTY]NBB16577.1 tetratricopeptide repeat protein [Caulobacter sp. SLTY]
MSRKRVLAATILAPALLAFSLPGAAQAWPFGGKKEEKKAEAPAKAPAAQAPGAITPIAATPTPREAKATAAQRAEARRFDPLAAAAFWGREFEVDPRDAEAGVALSQSLRAMGRYRDAVATAQAVLVVDPQNLNALLESARGFIGMGQGFYSIEPARKAAALSPRDWRPHSLLGVAYEQAQRDEEALAAHRQAVALAPDEPAALTNLAMFQAARGDLPAAEALLRRAAASPRATIQVRQNLALVVGLQGRLPEAEQLARRDLPPEMVDSNMAWLKAALAKGPAPGAGRSYQSLSQGGGGL